MSDQHGENNMTLVKLVGLSIAGLAMWAVIIWTGYRWWELVS